MPLVNLDYEDLEILISAYQKKDDDISAERERLKCLNLRLAKVVSDYGKDFVKDHNYVNQDILIDDFKRVEDLLDKIQKKEGYFMKTCREYFSNMNKGE